MAFVALAAFQVNAQQIYTSGSVWINADTTGINPSYAEDGTLASPLDPYPNNKEYQLNWLSAKDGNWKVDSGTKTGDKGNRMRIDVIGTVLTQFEIFTADDQSQLSVNYADGGVSYKNFEIVQYSGTSVLDPKNRNRRPQQLATSGIEGYLTPAHQAKPGSATVESSYENQLFVVSDQAGKLSVMKLSDFAEYVSATTGSPFVPGVPAYELDDTKLMAAGLISAFTTNTAEGDPAPGDISLQRQDEDRYYILSADYLTAVGWDVLTGTLGAGGTAVGATGAASPIAGWVMDNWSAITDATDPLWDGNLYALPIRNTDGGPNFTFNCFLHYFDVTTGLFTPITTGGSDFILRIAAGSATNFEVDGNGVRVYYDGPDVGTLPDQATTQEGAIKYTGTFDVPAVAPTAAYMKWLAKNIDKNGKPIYTPVYIKTEKVGGRWLQWEDLDGLFPACDDIEGSPLKYFEFTSDKGEFGGTVPGTDPAEFYSTLEISAYYHIAPLANATIQLNESQCDRIDVAQRTAKKYDYVNTSATQIRNYGIDLFRFRAPEADCKVLTSSARNAIMRQVGSSWTAFGGLFDLINDDYLGNGRTGLIATDVTAGTFADERLQQFAVWINEDGTYEVYPAAAIKIDHGNANQTGEFVANQALVENRHPNRPYYDQTDCTKIVSNIVEDERYFRVGWYDGSLTVNDIEGICIVTNQLQTATAFDHVQFTDECKTFVNKIDEEKWNFLVVNNGAAYFEDYVEMTHPLDDPTKPEADDANKNSRALREALRAIYLVENNDGEIRRWVLSTSVNDAREKRLIIVPEEVLIGKTGADDEDEYWKNPHDSVNMAAHWAVVKASKLGYKTANGYIIYNMLGDVIAYDPSTHAYQIVGGYLTNNAVISQMIDGTGVPADQWYDPNGTGTNLDAITARFAWNTVSLIDGAAGKDNFFLALQLAQPSKTTATSVNADLIMGRNIFGPNYVDQNTHDDYIISEVSVGAPTSCAGLMLSLKEIPYVPKNANSYPTEPDNTVINTSDPAYTDSYGNHRMVQDSLTAYLYLRGVFDFKEAKNVQTNNLVFTSKNVTIGASGDKIDVAVLATAQKDMNLEIIPLDGSRLDLLKNQTTGASPIDYLYEEEYKWFLVKHDGKYLVFDTVNTTAGNNRAKVALTFQNVDPRNATPVRFYQPLVGDKNQGNFLIQFYSAAQKYHNVTHTGGASGWHGHDTKWPDIEKNAASQLGEKEDGGRLMFAKLDAQTNYIHATELVNEATRFNYGYVKPDEPDPCCEDIYVQPEWMADNYILGLPVANYAFSSLGKFTEFGMSEVEDAFGEFAYLSKESVDITHNLIGYIYKGDFYHKDWIDGDKKNTVDKLEVSYLKGEFTDGLLVPVYTVENPAGKFLTVAPATDQKQQGSTVQDVTGTKLNWDEAIENRYDTAYYYPATQYFAIVDLCEDYDVKDIPAEYQRFAYFPLASYIVDYKSGDIVTEKYTTSAKKEIDVNVLQYNHALGTPFVCNDVTSAKGTDLSNAFRIGQYSVVGEDSHYSMVVVGATAGLTSNVPVEFAWGKNNYDMPFCEYQSVYNEETEEFYSFNGTFSEVSDYALAAHWAIEYAEDQTAADADPYLAVFEPEVTEEYSAAVTQTELTSQYYFKVLSQEEGTYTVMAYDLGNQTKANFFVVDSYKLTFTCVEHDLPYYDLEVDGNFNIDLSQLGIFEAIYLDRNIYTDFEKKSEVYDGSDLIGYQTLVKDVRYDDTENATYLRVYRSIRRQLSSVDENHVIPYYNFVMVGADAKGNEIEYFMNVKPAVAAGAKDSVRFSILTDAEKARLLDYEKAANRAEFKNYMFCLPYAVNGIDRVDTEKVPQPLYIMSYDVAKGNANAPYLLIIGAGSDLVTARKVSDAYTTAADNRAYDWSIYTINYGDIASDLVTVWTFALEQGEDNEWVRLKQIVTDGEGTGVLANAQIPGYTQYVGPSGETINYAKIVAKSDEGNLLFYFEGDTLIGDYAKRPIWYYRIQDPVSEMWLTDAVDSLASDGYWFNWQTTSTPYAYFGLLIENEDAYVAEGINADKNFQQTFGLRYIDATLDEEAGIYQTFVVVSQADYTARYYPSANYRYLANVQGRYVFVDDPADAMIFSWGRDVDDKWVSIDDVNATFAVVGAQGAIQVRNAEGVVDIYTVDGRKVSSTPVTGSDQTITAPAGVVIVKNGAKVAKVLVK